VYMKLAKAAAESLVLLDGEPLIAKKQDQMIHERFMHLLELPVAERLGQVEAKHLGAEAWG